MNLSKKEIEKFHSYIFSWWEKNNRDLPWRHTHDPYKILVSELMLQQTQVSRVLPKYAEFLATFPTVEALAQAPVASVLRMWKGMGYNRRALYLQKTAQAVVSQHGGKFPKNEVELLKLPGVGKYTVRALLVFAYQQDVAMVDTNIRQIITHFFLAEPDPASRDFVKPPSEKTIQEIADALVPAGKSWAWHQALMDFGASELKNLRPQRPKLPLSPQKVPFRQTNRFYRGRIMDVLREGDRREFVLLKEFMDQYDKPEDFMISVIHGLEKDGLLIRHNGMLSLP